MKKLMLLMFGIILMSLVSVSAYTPHKQGTDWNIVFDDGNATSCNITTLEYPDGSYDYINEEMTKTGNTFNYTISGENLTTLGDTCVGIVCYNPSASPQYEEGSVCRDVNAQGFELGNGEGNIYVWGMVVVFALFCLSLYFAINLPWNNPRSQSGNILYIEYKKYLKLAMWFVSYLILIFFFAIGKGMSYAFLQSTELYGFFNVGFTILLIGIMPVLIISVVFLIIGTIMDKKIQKAIERGIPVR